MPNETRILILDDEIDLLDTLVSYLREDCRYRVYPAARAEDAIAYLRRGTVDLAALRMNIERAIGGHQIGGTVTTERAIGLRASGRLPSTA